MTLEILFMFALLAAVIVVFAMDKLPMDLVALSVVVVLALSGTISPQEAVSGFGNSLVLMIAGLFVVGEALLTTGIANRAGSWLLHVGGDSEVRLLLFLLPLVALLSAFMSSTGAVALLIPVVLSVAKKSSLQSGLLFMPLAFCSLIGGMLTLIGTPPNIIVSEQMTQAGLAGFGFFDFTPIGAVIFVVGIGYFLTVGRFLLPTAIAKDTRPKARTIDDFTEQYALGEQLHKLVIEQDSPLVGCTVMELKLRREFEVTPFALKHAANHTTTLLPILLNTRMRAGDVLWAYATQAHIKTFCQHHALTEQPKTSREVQRLHEQFGFAEVLIPPNSSFANQTLKDIKLREHLRLNAIGVCRSQKPLTMSFTERKLAEGDTLLLTGSWAHIRKLVNGKDLLVLDTPVELEDIPVHAGKAITASAIMLAMLIAMTAGWLPNLTVILLAALAMIVTNCVTLKEAYASLNTTSLVLIAGMLPMALAMQKSGAIDYLVQHLMTLFQDVSPTMLCAAFFVLTSLLSQFISNTATTVLLAPIALSTSQLLGYQPEPLMMTVAIAASTAFSTPIASPVNTLVLSPGKYRFTDFIKVGAPLQLITLVITLVLVPILFPFV